MSVNNQSQSVAGSATSEKTVPQNEVYASLLEKINLTPVAERGDLNGFNDNTIMAETVPGFPNAEGESVTRGYQG